MMNAPMEPNPVRSDRIYGISSYTHNLTPEEYAWVAKVMHAVDTDFMNSWIDMWNDDGWLIVGNSPRIEGKEAIRAWVRKNFAAIRVLRHNILRTMSVPSAGLIFQESIMSVVLHEDSENTVSYNNLSATFHRKPGDHKMSGLQLYQDITPWMTRLRNIKSRRSRL